MPNEDDGEKDQSLGTKVTGEFKRDVRIVAAHKGMSMSEYVRRAVERQLEEDVAEGNTTSPAAIMAD